MSFYLVAGYFSALVMYLITLNRTKADYQELSALAYSFPFISIGCLSENLAFIFICYLFVDSIIIKSQSNCSSYKKFLPLVIKSIIFTLFSVSFLSNQKDINFSNSIILSNITLILLLIFTLSSYGLFPFHFFQLRQLQKNTNKNSIIFLLLNPIAFSLALKGFSHLNFEIVSPYLYSFFLVICLNSIYLILAAFFETQPVRFILYISNSLLLLLVGCLIFVDHAPRSAWALYYFAFIICLSGALICFSFYSKRYGLHSLKNESGLFKLSPFNAWALLVFFMVLSNAPMTLTFLGEDIILYQIFHASFFLGILCATIFALIAIALFRFYTIYIWGVYKGNFPILPLLTKEKNVLIIAIAIIFFSSIFLR